MRITQNFALERLMMPCASMTHGSLIWPTGCSVRRGYSWAAHRLSMSGPQRMWPVIYPEAPAS